ncbi:MAG: alpha/beta fold hydrolase [Candidatus Zixiibacteriota bacterium]
MSRQTKEIVQTVAFLIVVAALVFVFVIYPMARIKAALGRADMGDYNPDSIPANDATAYIEAGFAPDTFSVESDGWTTLACLYLPTDTATANPTKGTVFLLHEDGADRDAMTPWARLFVDSGYAVVVYDQRASGLSTAKYRSDGQLEAGDIQEIIRYLDLRGRIVHPVILVGGRLGADAALLAAQQEQRVDAVVAMNPYLTTKRMLDILKDEHGMFRFPFFRTVMWWWYGIRSSYAVNYRDIDDLKGVGAGALLLLPADKLEDKEVQRLLELSETGLLDVQAAPSSDDELYQRVYGFVSGIG